MNLKQSLNSVTILFTLFVFAPQSFADSRIEGRWEDEPYIIEVLDSYASLRGSWGSQNFNIEYVSAYKSFRGQLPSGAFQFSWNSTYQSIQGNFGCGNVQLGYLSSYQSLRGNFCGSNIEVGGIANPQEAQDYLVDFFADLMTEEFPLPARSLSKMHLKKHLRTMFK